MPLCGLLPPLRPRPSSLPRPPMPRRSRNGGVSCGNADLHRQKLAPELPSQRQPLPAQTPSSSPHPQSVSPHDSVVIPASPTSRISQILNHHVQLLPVDIDETLEQYAESGSDASSRTEFVDDPASIHPTMACIAASSSQSKAIDATMAQSWAASTLDRTMLAVAARAAFLAASQGACLVGKVALGGATMTMAMAGSVLQVIRHARDHTSSAKVTPLPPTTDAEMFPQSPKNPPPICTTNQASDPPSSSPRLATPRCVDSPVSSPDGRKHNSTFKIQAQKDARNRRFSSSNRLESHQVSRMVEFSEEKSAVKSLPDSCSRQKPVHREMNVSPIQQKSSNLGSALATVGLWIALSGLLSVGLVGSIVAVVCWWYAIPSIKQMAGDKPTVVRVHHGDVLRKADQKDDKGNGSSKKELRPGDYRKRVIMEGILERDRRPTG